MNMRTIGLITVISSIALSAQISAMWPSQLWSTFRTQDKTVQAAVALTTVGAAGYTAYRGYQTMQARIAQYKESLEDQLVDLSLLALKPNGNCTPEELMQKAKLNTLVDAVLNDTQVAGIKDRWLDSTALNWLVQLNLVKKNDKIGTPEAQKWITLFADKIPHSLTNNVQDLLVQRIKDSLSNSSGNSSDKTKDRIKTKLRAKIAAMNSDDIKAQFVPEKVGTLFAELDSLHSKGDRLRGYVASSQIGNIMAKFNVEEHPLMAKTVRALFNKIFPSVAMPAQIMKLVVGVQKPSEWLQEQIKNNILGAIDSIDNILDILIKARSGASSHRAFALFGDME